MLIATPALLGAHPGLAVEYMWVDSLAALWGGRRLWGLPKELADFTWDERGVRISDATGPLLSLALNRDATPHGPALPAATGSIGQRDGAWAWALFPLWARLGWASLRLRDLSPRFGFTLARRPLLSLVAPECRVTFSPARLLPIRPTRRPAATGPGAER